ncbi:hypothetical protein ADUPG1_012526 [Aduncisulcus paluster]|uniref:ABC transmembrane type-1 domain-containing protein n=1 Tax=Aduncisulcus paluster TaxID=2918883 RepID=A0ABQ5JZQ5_9EUKA|nr:hypothetical protein ADUPG1_012526 [Aduncisulcus paluster]
MEKNPREKAGFLSKLFFLYISPIIGLSKRRPIEFSDVHPTDSLLNHDKMSKKFASVWSRECKKTNKKPSLVKAILFTVWNSPCFILSFIGKLIQSVLQFFPSMVLKRFTNLLNEIFDGHQALETSESLSFLDLFRIIVSTPSLRVLYLQALFLALSIFIVPLIRLLAIQQYYFFSSTMSRALNTMLRTQMYQKVMNLDEVSRQKCNNGSILNLVLGDVRSVSSFVNNIHQQWSQIFQLILGISLIASNVGSISFFGVAILAVLIPFQKYLAKCASKRRAKRGSLIRARVKLVNEIINGIRIIKSSAYEPFFVKKVKKERKDILKRLFSIRILNQSQKLIVELIPMLLSFTIFVTQSLKMNKIKDSCELEFGTNNDEFDECFSSYANIFSISNFISTISLFNSLWYPLQAIPKMLDQYGDVQEAEGRIMTFMALKEKNKQEKQHVHNIPHGGENTKVVIGTTTVSTHESKNRSDLEKEEIEISQGVDASWDVVDESVFTKLKRKSREERKKEKKEKRRKERERKKEERAKRREVL